MSDAALVDAVYAVARPHFKNDQACWDWMARKIPAFFGRTPVEVAAKEGIEEFRKHLDLIFSFETTA